MRERATRRAVLAAGTSAVALLAGCSSGTEEENDDAPTNGDDSAHSVTMEPVGTVEFDDVPESWLAYESDYADMGVALGLGDGLRAVGEPDRFHTDYYDELGVSYPEDPTPLWNDGVDEELFYELDADVHLVDPNWLEHNEAFGLDEDDVAEIEANVGPFVGNTIFRRTDEWHDYEYYDLYEAFEKVAQVFRREDRYEAFADLHGEFLEEVESHLPGEDERPDALLVWEGTDEPEEFVPYRISDEGAGNKQYRDLGVDDALDGTGIDGLSTSDRGTIDYEAVLDVDPDALFVRGHEDKRRDEFEDTVLAYMQEHDVASDLTAVENERVFRGGPIYQGPIYNLFVTERTARELYPDSFDDELFDREAVSKIVTNGA
ncbi:Fe3+-hydroxamate ABC transporter substrate-binding protein [Natronococcus pandeyae]|uniref:Fe3+-hydroxamate ABC transporter substrate-binding protein n=1 Tax=Natronococcus pandeyae TaxID=2055836 RepID=A0A8J8TRT9_9EURY|nr:ABC transporter substrate-binding protein [Natronococcus pandeyae]TYL39878.1 Fe3+-hydroxamate ABC transporter substrate-binding protein [Natronococcus pandeyae]